MKYALAIFLGALSITFADVCLLTLPKTGSGLLGPLLFELTSGKKGCALGTIVKEDWDEELIQSILANHSLPEKQYYSSHFDCKKTINAFLTLHPDCKVIVGVRDLRDMLVSFVYWIDSSRNTDEFNTRKEYVGFRELDNREKWDAYTFEEKLNTLILANNNNFCYSKEIPLAISVLSQPNTICVKYESLVGEGGGGTLSQQIQTIKQIANFLSINCSDDRAQSIAQRIYGKGGTFRAGKIGAWSKHFTESNLRTFNKHFQKYQEQLGY